MRSSDENQCQDLLLESAESSDGVYCIICLSQTIRKDDPNLSLQKLQSIKNLALSIHSETNLLAPGKNQNQAKALLAKISNPQSTQVVEGHQNNYSHLSSNKQSLNICINCLSKAQEQMQSIIRGRNIKLAKRISQLHIHQNKDEKPKSAQPRSYKKLKKNFLAHDDQSNSQTEDQSGGSLYLSKIAYGKGTSQKIIPKRENSDKGSFAKKQAKKTMQVPKRNTKAAEVSLMLAVESHREDKPPDEEKTNYCQKLKEKIVIEGFPNKQPKPMMKYSHRSTEVFIERAKVQVPQQSQGLIECIYCRLQLKKQSALPSFNKNEQFACRICFTLYEANHYLISFEKNHEQKRQQMVSASRKKRAETVTKPRNRGQNNMQLILCNKVSPRPVSHSGPGQKKQAEEHSCAMCSKSGVTLIKQAGKIYCIYCYYRGKSGK